MSTAGPGTERLFAYGSLQLESVQRATFGRRVSGKGDRLRGYRLVPLLIEDPAVVAVSGKSEHTMAERTDQDCDSIAGTVLELSRMEIE